MTTGEILGYTKRLKSITESNTSNREKDLRLANLMTDLEGAYQIPLFGGERLERFKKEHPHVFQLYRTASMERSFE